MAEEDGCVVDGDLPDADDGWNGEAIDFVGGNDGVTGDDELHALNLHGGWIDEDAAGVVFAQDAACGGTLAFREAGELDDVWGVGVFGLGWRECVVHARLLTWGDGVEAAGEDSAEDGGAV